MSELFTDPAQPGIFKADQWVGHLLLCEPERYLEQVQTINGVSDAVEGTITVLTAPQGPEELNDARVFQNVLIATLRPAIGRLPVLGRLAMGQPSPGKNAAYLLNPASPEDRAYAEQYLRNRPSRQVAVPGGGPAVTPQPVQQQYPVAQAQPVYQPAGPGHPVYDAYQAAQQQSQAQQPAQPQPGPNPLGPPPVVHGTPVQQGQPQPGATQPAPAPAVPQPVAGQPQPQQAVTVSPAEMANLPPDVQRLLAGGQQQPAQ